MAQRGIYDAPDLIVLLSSFPFLPLILPVQLTIFFFLQSTVHNKLQDAPDLLVHLISFFILRPSSHKKFSYALDMPSTSTPYI
jgi:hypothetical protein